MKILLRLAKQSAKNIFKIVRSQSPFYCNALSSEIKVTKLFYNHIVNNSKKKRSDYEIVERILIIPFLSEILLKGVLIQMRNEKYGKTFRITYKIKSDIFCVIILSSQDNYSLLSCFRKNSLYEKRALS